MTLLRAISEAGTWDTSRECKCLSVSASLSALVSPSLLLFVTFSLCSPLLLSFSPS